MFTSSSGCSLGGAGLCSYCTKQTLTLKISHAYFFFLLTQPHINIDHNRHRSWSNIRNGAGPKIIRGGKPDCPNTLSKKRLFTFSCPADVFCRMPDGEQCLQGHSKEALFECYLKLRRANDTHTHTVDTHYVGLQMQSIQMCDEKYDDILNN